MSEPAASPPLLSIRSLDAFYGDFQALYGIDLEIVAGEVIAVIGANGAGKSTLLKSIAGMTATRRGRIDFSGESIATLAPHTIVARGIALVPEGRRLFPSLTVEENLLIGGQLGRPGPWSLDSVFRLFPDLKSRREHKSTALSGGQQQMVAIGRALMAEPRLLLLDEPSLGLAPMLVEEILGQLRAMADQGLAILLVEQMARAALAVADHGYVLESGRLVAQGPAAALLADADLAAAYLGETIPEGAHP